MTGYMKEALQLAKQAAQRGEVPVGAVVSKAHLLSGTLAPAPQVIGGLLAAQSEALLQDFFAERRKKADLPLDKQVEKSI